MIRLAIFICLLVGACGYALARGHRDARIVAAVCVVASLASVMLASRYAAVETGVMLVDLATLGAFLWVALESARFWPLWVTGLQLTTVLGHFFRAVDPHLLPLAYAAALRSWSYPILIILALGVWREQRRERDGGPALIG